MNTTQKRPCLERSSPEKNPPTHSLSHLLGLTLEALVFCTSLQLKV
ncbi:MAG: hypothetical protein WCJ99_12165 [Betaproteobacteria bacterium]